VTEREVIGGVAFIVGVMSGVLWSRWRHQVVSELRAIRQILEQEPVAERSRMDTETVGNMKGESHGKSTNT
jgi:hypothetical protein